MLPFAKVLVVGRKVKFQPLTGNPRQAVVKAIGADWFQDDQNCFWLFSGLVWLVFVE